MTEVKISGGSAKITDEELIVTDYPLTRVKRRVEYRRIWVYIGIVAFGFTVVGYFGQEGLSFESILGFAQFLGWLVAISVGIALLITILGKRENPLKGGLLSPHSWRIPLRNITRIGAVDGERKLAVEFVDDGTAKTAIIPFLAGMKEEQNRLVTLLDEHAEDMNDSGDNPGR